MRSLTLVIATAGAYALLRGWDGAPTLLLRACFAVATLVVGFAVWGIRRNPATPRMFSLRRATWLDYLALGSMIIFTEACFVALTSMMAAPAQMLVDNFRYVVEDPAKPAADGTGGGGTDGDVQFDGNRSGDWKFSKKLNRPLPPNSNLKPSTKPEVFIELENSEDTNDLFNSRIHLRSFAFSRFNGIAWSAKRTTSTRIEAPITFPVPAKLEDRKTFRYRVYHSVSRSGQNLFTSLHGVRSTDSLELSQLAESIYLLPEVNDPRDGYTYTATSSPVHFTELISEPLTAADAKPEEFELPPELAELLQKTSEEFRYEPTLATQLIGIRNYLQDNYTYSLTTTNTTGANPLDNFLYREKRGYCEHFATAAAMLCRTLGVPSRIAYGWSGGRLYKDQNMFVFRAKDAHAWTEIKLKGYGWVVFDTTPPDSEDTPATHSAPDNEAAPDPMETIAADLDHDASGNLGDRYLLHIHPWTLYLSLGVIGLCGLSFMITRALRRPQTAPDGRPLAYQPPGYVLQFKQTCAALGHPMPAGRTLRQHIRYLENRGAAPSLANDLLSYHYDTIYADTPSNKKTERKLQQMIHHWKKSAAQKDGAS
ncbi:MAG: transglutaminase domain-containing protein [Verrucomicrobiae bacterium]|nr:transglutaminase domain-containing protein [Verrucomicrobiae bacterium]NNJ85636.1 transglutaminase domain-containing protein [Akkermansiaceae bacterium]